MKILILLFAVVLIAIYGCQKPDIAQQGVAGEMTKENENLHKATFAGGCFWCTEADFEKLPGVVKVVSGYTGGQKENPTYAEVSSGKTGHVEAIQVYYDPSKISYEELLDALWKHIDPTDGGGQFVDRGPSIAVPFSITMKSKKDWLRNRKRPWENPESSINLSLRRFFNSQNFMRQKSITKTITRTML